MNEGVIQFELNHSDRPLPSVHHPLIDELIGWRQLLRRMELLGARTDRYGGLGFGNVSCRIPPWTRGRVRFLVTGSQTGLKAQLSRRDVSLVERCDPLNGRIDSIGVVPPSSEATTHGAIYRLAPHVRWVFHGHSPEIWTARTRFTWPTSASSAGYGTTAMAGEVQRLWRETQLSECQLLIMGGHQDGVIGFGRSGEEAFSVLTSALHRALVSG